jgi:hypothetical protein
MSPSPTIAKPITVNFTGATTNDPVTVKNLTTGEIITKHPSGSLLRIEGRQKGIIVSANAFPSGWTVGDVLLFSVGGATAGSVLVTLTADTDAPQDSTTTAAAVSTAVLDI